MVQNVEKKLLKIPEISKLQFTDELLFRKAFQKESLQYARSWLYVLRAAHCKFGKMGYKFISKELLAVIGYRHNIIYITPIFDKTQGIKLQQLCQKILYTTNRQIIIKKFSQQAYPYVKYSQKDQHITEGLFEDESHPETILKLSKLFTNLEGDINPSAKKFIKQIKRFEKLNMHYEIIDSATLIPQQKIKQFLNKDPEKYASYSALIKYLYQQRKNNRYKLMIFLHNKKIQGLYVSEIFSSTKAGLYCAVTSKDKPGITEWMDYCFLRQMHHKRIHTIYIGGAETKGIKTYCTKLLPSKPKYTVMAIGFNNSTKKQN
ncbi:hypothetical protein KJ980_07265 [Patescibacteria group bacterium]|nr:hypothetical protein [Patescibacteria group bacterium]MBU4016156.1 hypothetical protein [Patescibacteria group bacterium]MBU4099420.1 hypothetical protein [Patescibacteria group bacterium]